MKKIFAVLSATLAFAAVSCDKSEDTTPLSVDCDQSALTPHGGQAELTITTTADWTIAITGNSDGVEVSPASGSGNGSATVTVSPNSSSRPRKIVLEITAGNARQDVTITQPVVTTSHVRLKGIPDEFDAAEHTVTLTVESNASWTIAKDSGVEWLTITPESGTGNGEIELRIASNLSTRSRSTTLTASIDGFSKDYKIVQQADEPTDFTIDDLVGTWQAAGTMLTVQDVYLTGTVLDYQVEIVKDGSEGLLIRNFGNVGITAEEKLEIKATFDAASETLTIPFQELTQANRPGGQKFFYASYDQEVGSNNFDRTDLRHSLPATPVKSFKSGLSIEIKSAAGLSPLVHIISVPEMMGSQYYSGFIFRTQADGNTYVGWDAIFVDMKLTKQANQ